MKWIMQAPPFRRAGLFIMQNLASWLDYHVIAKPLPEVQIVSEVPVWRVKGKVHTMNGESIAFVVDVVDKTEKQSRDVAMDKVWEHYPFSNILCDSCEQIELSIKRKTPQRIEGVGYIYLIKSSHNLYKIGLTAEPKWRIARLDVTLPFEIDVLHLIPTDDMRRTEKRLHETYKSKRQKGEWFALSDDDVMAICSIKEMKWVE